MNIALGSVHPVSIHFNPMRLGTLTHKLDSGKNLLWCESWVDDSEIAPMALTAKNSCTYSIEFPASTKTRSPGRTP